MDNLKANDRIARGFTEEIKRLLFLCTGRMSGSGKRILARILAGYLQERLQKSEGKFKATTLIFVSLEVFEFTLMYT